MNLIKILLINFILVVFFLGIVLVSPPILSFINQSLFSANEIIDKRSNLKIYQDYLPRHDKPDSQYLYLSVLKKCYVFWETVNA